MTTTKDERALFEDTYTLWLVPKRRDAHNLNLSLLERFHVELRARLGLQHAWVCPIRARDRGKVRGAHDDVGDLPPFVVLCRGAPVSLCVNLNLQFKVFNGSVGRIVDVVFENGLSPHHDGKSWPL